MALSDHAGGMGGMSMGDGVPDPFYMQRMYWTTIGAAIAFATLVNVLNKLLALQRYRQTYRSPQIQWLISPKIQIARGKTKVHLLGVLRHSDSHSPRAQLRFVGHCPLGNVVFQFFNLGQDNPCPF